MILLFNTSIIQRHIYHQYTMADIMEVILSDVLNKVLLKIVWGANMIQHKFR